MSSIVINNLSTNGATAANDIGAASGADTPAKLVTLIDSTDRKIPTDEATDKAEAITASGLDAIDEGAVYGKTTLAGADIANDVGATSGGTTGAKLAAATDQATTAAKGTVAFASTGTQDATKVPKATAAEIAALLTSGGYSIAPASGLASMDNIADGTTYARVLSTIASGLNNGWYGALYDGLEWDEATDTYTRVGRNSSSPNYLAVQKGMRRCVLTASGEVAYYLYPTNSALKEDGVTASKLDGTDGQVMVEIPKFYQKYSYVGTKHRWEISELKLPGYEVHPVFKSDATELSKVYVGAFEACLYDITISGYVCGNGVETGWAQFTTSGNVILCSGLTAPFENITIGQKITIAGTVSNNGTFTIASGISNQSIATVEALVDEIATSCTIDTTKDTTNDKLGSVVGFSPITKITRANARKMASNVGTGWTQETFDMATAVQLLYLIEYGTFFSQNTDAGKGALGIGPGMTNVSNWSTYNNYYPIAKTGNSISTGNATASTAGSTSAATEVTKHLTYRGIENPFGHIWKWIDGFNINNNIAYVCNNSTNFADDTTSNYTQITASGMANTNGYQETLWPIGRGFLPKTVGGKGDSDSQITDYYYQNTGWRVSMLGGAAHHGSDAGVFYWRLDPVSGNSFRVFGARLGFRKN